VKSIAGAVFLALVAGAAARAGADPLNCSLAGYKPRPGLTAAVADNTLTVTWTGDRQRHVRLRFTIERGTPTIQELAVQSGGDRWNTIATHAVADYRIVSGLRRMSNQQMVPLRGLGVALTSDVVDRYRWDRSGTRRSICRRRAAAAATRRPPTALQTSRVCRGVPTRSHARPLSTARRAATS
jgi:hypothetical protein